MFYVTGAKIYLAQYDQNLKMYPEVKLYRRDDGSIYPEVLSTGIAKKPLTRENCTLQEVIAKFGAGAIVKVKQAQK